MRWLLATAAAWLAAAAAAGEIPRFEAREVDADVGKVCYAVTVADVDGDGDKDVVAATEDSVLWYANPSWEKAVIVRGVTARDNVCIQARDVDGDGKVDFALGAGWQPTNTQSGGTLQFLTRTGGDGTSWKVVPAAEEPTLHRLRWGDVLGTGTEQLVVAPLQGRGTKGPDWGAGQGSRILVFSAPADPWKGPWPVEVADDSLHAAHNIQLTDLDGNGHPDIVVAAWEGVFALRKGPAGWAKIRVGAGDQESSPSKGSSEVKVGRLSDGRKYIATVEPWHGSKVVLYTPPKSGAGLWDRRVVDEGVSWGHAVWCADLDGDGDDEIVVGQRDPSRDPARAPRGPGILVYDIRHGSNPPKILRGVVEDGGVAVEDLVAADLDGDGRPDLVAGGRASHNVRIYFNRGDAP